MRKPKWYNWTGDPGWDEYCKFGSIVIGICFLILGLFLGLIITAGAQPQTQSCPAGSYNIGTKDGINPICKLEPTGCPYGDSIPMDMCNKFKPVEPVQQAPVEVLSETVIQEGGK